MERLLGTLFSIGRRLIRAGIRERSLILLDNVAGNDEFSSMRSPGAKERLKAHLVSYVPIGWLVGSPINTYKC